MFSSFSNFSFVNYNILRIDHVIFSAYSIIEFFEGLSFLFPAFIFYFILVIFQDYFNTDATMNCFKELLNNPVKLRLLMIILK